MSNGMVYLIGAGPGNPKLITVRGLECLRKADVVVYDRLGTAELLKQVRPGAEVISVGKASGDHTLPQDEINQLLVRKAKEGKVVARLKGGDPFVFGRGGEEAEVLVSHGIPFEVVPGVTSAISAPAFAGIPVTHRTCTSTFAIVTGHEDPRKERAAIEWSKIATGAGTIVFLMGLGNLGNISQHLIENGRSPVTPVAVIRWGSRADQQTVTGTLATIEEAVARAKLGSPAVIVVGEVVGLRTKLSWWDNRPLLGRRIAVVRGWDQAVDTAEGLEHLGATVCDIPVVYGFEPASWVEADRTIGRMRDSHGTVFTSPAGVRCFFGRLDALGLDARALGGTRIVATGLAASALRIQGVRPDFAAGGEGFFPAGEEPDTVVFADAFALPGWVELFGPAIRGVVACVDQRTADVAKALGMCVHAVPEEASAEAIAVSLKQHGAEQDGSVVWAGTLRRLRAAVSSDR